MSNTNLMPISNTCNWFLTIGENDGKQNYAVLYGYLLFKENIDTFWSNCTWLLHVGAL